MIEGGIRVALRYAADRLSCCDLSGLLLLTSGGSAVCLPDSDEWHGASLRVTRRNRTAL